MAAQLADLPKVSTTHARLSRFLASRQTHYNITLAGQQGEMKLLAKELPPQAGYTLNLTVNNERLSVSVDESMLTLLLPGRLEHHAATKLPNELVMAALISSINDTLQHISQMFGTPASLSGFQANASSPEPTELCIIITMNGVSCSANMPINDTSMGLLNQLPLQQGYPLSALPVWANLELGRSLLSHDDTGNLEHGDIVFLQQHVTGQQLIIRFNRLTAFLAEAEGNQVTIQQRMAPMDEEHDSNDAQASSDGSVDLSDISVELLFEVGRQQFNASDLQGIQPGYIFELDRTIEQPVRIRANGKVIAECQLVQIDNRLGAKITKLKK